jgi:hypothetical protein
MSRLSAPLIQSFSDEGVNKIPLSSDEAVFWPDDVRISALVLEHPEIIERIS